MGSVHVQAFYGRRLSQWCKFQQQSHLLWCHHLIFELLAHILIRAQILGKIRRAASEWEAVTNDKWVLSIAETSYRLEFQDLSPLCLPTGAIHTH